MDDEKESCPHCGKEPLPGVILVIATFGFFWFAVGIAAGMAIRGH